MASSGSFSRLRDASIKLRKPRLGAPSLIALRGGGKFTFEVEYKGTKFGECVGLVGSSPKLGDWKTPIKMDGKSYPLWKAAVDIDAGDALLYKYCVIGPDNHIKAWESSGDASNRRLDASPDLLSTGRRHDGQYGGGAAAPRPAAAAHAAHGDPGPAPHLGHAAVTVVDGELDPFGAALARADKGAGSWRQKLEAV
jgi:hypothetical protein